MMQHRKNMSDEEIAEIQARVAQKQQQDQQQQVDQAEQENTRAVKLVQAKAQVDGFQKKNGKTPQGADSRESLHRKGEFDVPTGVDTRGGRGGQAGGLPMGGKGGVAMEEWVKLVALRAEELITKNGDR
jgi:hypothetical protein